MRRTDSGSHGGARRDQSERHRTDQWHREDISLIGPITAGEADGADYSTEEEEEAERADDDEEEDDGPPDTPDDEDEERHKCDDEDD